jgi:hypothetical protein
MSEQLIQVVSYGKSPDIENPARFAVMVMYVQDPDKLTEEQKARVHIPPAYRWHFNRVIKRVNNQSQLLREAAIAAKSLDLPMLGPLYMGQDVTLTQLKMLPQTDEVKVLGVKLKLMESSKPKPKLVGSWG